MRQENEQSPGAFSRGARRYTSSPYRETRATAKFGQPVLSTRNRFSQALKRLSSEDEELSLPEGQGPIIYKDGIFQIDVDNAGAPSTVDPALKGLIDSILGR